jgi:hypothetical protein
MIVGIEVVGRARVTDLPTDRLLTEYSSMDHELIASAIGTEEGSGR